MPSSAEWECESVSSSSSSSSSSSDSSSDDDQVNTRLSPYWPNYRDLTLSMGYRLDTVRDVREHYQHYGLDPVTKTRIVDCSGCSAPDDNALCKDPGLPENLFRATCCRTGTKLVVKAVNRLSREAQTVRYISSLRHDPMNHCIPILDLVDVPADGMCFIVMEEWSSHLLPQIPSQLRGFLSVIYQCIEHIVFMHRNRMVHLDISLHNFLTDYRGRCACIDYELSQRVDDPLRVGIYWPKGTEVPPELECSQPCDPYMIDVWALGILILRACKIANLYIPELFHLARPMLNHDPRRRPSAAAVLREFKRLVLLMGDERLDQPC